MQVETDADTPCFGLEKKIFFFSVIYSVLAFSLCLSFHFETRQKNCLQRKSRQSKGALGWFVHLISTCEPMSSGMSAHFNLLLCKKYITDDYDSVAGESIGNMIGPNRSMK